MKGKKIYQKGNKNFKSRRTSTELELKTGGPFSMKAVHACVLRVGIAA